MNSKIITISAGREMVARYNTTISERMAKKLKDREARKQINNRVIDSYRKGTA